jgi:hypothetical protein
LVGVKKPVAAAIAIVPLRAPRLSMSVRLCKDACLCFIHVSRKSPIYLLLNNIQILSKKFINT